MPADQVGESAAGRLTTLIEGCPPDRMGALTAQVMIDLGLARSVSIWLIDHGSTLLVDLVGTKSPVSMGGSIVGRVATTEEAIVHQERAYLPLARRGQVIGVMEISPAPDEGISQLAPLAVAVSNAVLATNLVSDVIERTRGATNLSLPATIQHRNLPLTSYADDEVEVGARLEPAFNIAGDVIDYAANPEGIHLAIFDAVGHGLRATMLSTWAVATYRLMRRKGAPLAEIVSAIDEVIAGNAERNEFVTGIMLLVKPGEGIVEVANAGHPSPLLIRDGAAHFLTGPTVQLPMGLGVSSSASHTVPSQPRDVIFLYSDGVVQARNGDLAVWGEQTLSEQAVARTSEGLSPSNICRQILSAVTTWSNDVLGDDASIVALRRKG